MAARPRFALRQSPDIGRDPTSGQMKQLSGRDPREYTFPAVASIYLGLLLLFLAVRIGITNFGFWVAVACSGALVMALEWRVRRFVDVWGDDVGLILVRRDRFEKINWKDVAAVQNHYSSQCGVLFRLDTPFGRVISFPLPRADRLIGFEHPNAIWIRERIEAASSGTPVPDASSWSVPGTKGEQLGLIAVAVLLALGGAAMIREGLAKPTRAIVTGSSELLGCEEHTPSWGPVQVVLRVPNVRDGMKFIQPASYLRYVREACASRGLVSWAAVLREDGHPQLVAFERVGVPGGFTEEAYSSWRRSVGVLWIAMGSGALFASVAFAATVLGRSRKRTSDRTVTNLVERRDPESDNRKQ
jgi:hypothetical protein